MTEVVEIDEGLERELERYGLTQKAGNDLEIDALRIWRTRKCAVSSADARVKALHVCFRTMDEAKLQLLALSQAKQLAVAKEACNMYVMELGGRPLR